MMFRKNVGETKMSHPYRIAYNKEIISGSMAAAVGVAFFALATALGAYVRIPVPGSPVPITLQTFFAIFAVSVAAFSAGSLIILALGAAWLVTACGMSWANAMALGVLPFIPGDITKVLLASVAYREISRRANTLFP
jgi:biotin transporter BioY